MTLGKTSLNLEAIIFEITLYTTFDRLMGLDKKKKSQIYRDRFLFRYFILLMPLSCKFTPLESGHPVLGFVLKENGPLGTVDL